MSELPVRPDPLANPPLPESRPATGGGAPAPRYALSVGLFLLTLFSTTTLGAGWYLSTRTDVTTYLLPFLSPGTIVRVWTDRQLLTLGLSFSVPLLFILLCHELGHYLACRHHRIPATLPYFLPVPIGLGTFGAFIRIRGLISTRSQLLDVGVAGPIAGFVALVPFLLLGVARSTVSTIELAPDPQASPYILLVPGESLALRLTSLLFHGPLPADSILDLHPFALAAWVGLLATALNLLPLGQLDGGHILYAALGPRQRYLAWPLWLALAALSLLWPGWFMWCLIVLILGLRHPPVLREELPLDGRRRLLAAVGLLLFLLSFMPRPATVLPILVDEETTRVVDY